MPNFANYRNSCRASSLITWIEFRVAERMLWSADTLRNYRVRCSGPAYHVEAVWMQSGIGVVKRVNPGAGRAERTDQLPLVDWQAWIGCCQYAVGSRTAVGHFEVKAPVLHQK